MKGYTPIFVAFAVIILCMVILMRFSPNDQPVLVSIQDDRLSPLSAPSRPHETLDLPEYRPPPIQKYYRPQAPHQVGLLKGETEGDDLRPIYAKPSRTHRDRFFYWTTGGNGHNNYSVPVTLDGRDCTEDLGCQEMYGNESVSVWDNPEAAYKSHIYRTDMYF
jgi:hypothetical protein